MRAPRVEVAQRPAQRRCRRRAVGRVRPEQQLDRGRLAGAVGPEEAEHLARLDADVERLERDRAAVRLAQAHGSRSRGGHVAIVRPCLRARGVTPEFRTSAGRDSLGGTGRARGCAHDRPRATLHRTRRPAPCSSSDCPFCLAPLPLDAATGTLDCPDCAVRLELADETRAPRRAAGRRELAPRPDAGRRARAACRGLLRPRPPRSMTGRSAVPPRRASTPPAAPRRRRTAAAPPPCSGRTRAGSAGGSGSPAGCAPRPASRPRGSSGPSRSPSPGGSGDGRHGHERLRVRVARRPDDALRRADLHDPAEVHHRDPVRDDPGDRQVVGDEQVGQAALAAQVEHQAQELGADRDVEHRHRLVRDDELRVHDERPGDDDALALAAGELVRVAGGEVRGRAAGPRPRAPRYTRSWRSCRGSATPLTTSGSATNSRDGVLRVERLVRVLEDQLDAPAVRRAARASPTGRTRPRRRTRSGRRSAS